MPGKASQKILLPLRPAFSWSSVRRYLHSIVHDMASVLVLVYSNPFPHLRWKRRQYHVKLSTDSQEGSLPWLNLDNIVLMT